MFRRIRERLGLDGERRALTQVDGPALVALAEALARRPVGVSARELAEASPDAITVDHAAVVLDGLRARRLAVVHMGRWYAGEPIELEGTGE